MRKAPSVSGEACLVFAREFLGAREHGRLAVGGRRCGSAAMEVLCVHGIRIGGGLSLVKPSHLARPCGPRTTWDCPS